MLTVKIFFNRESLTHESESILGSGMFHQIANPIPLKTNAVDRFRISSIQDSVGLRVRQVLRSD